MPNFTWTLESFLWVRCLRNLTETLLGRRNKIKSWARFPWLMIPFWLSLSLSLSFSLESIPSLSLLLSLSSYNLHSSHLFSLPILLFSLLCSSLIALVMRIGYLQAIGITVEERHFSRISNFFQRGLLHWLDEGERFHPWVSRYSVTHDSCMTYECVSKCLWVSEWVGDWVI